MDHSSLEKFITDKNKSLSNYFDGLLLRTNQIFHWDNLPGTLYADRLEYMIQKLGKVYIIQHDNDYFIVSGTPTGKQDIYGDFNEVTVNNPYVSKVNGIYQIAEIDNVQKHEKIAVEIKNNYLGLPIDKLVSHYAVLITECEITLRSFIINSRNIFTLVAGDNKSKKNCEIFLQRLTAGDLTILSDNAFLESVKILPNSINGDLLYKLIETYQFLKASALHDVGINANYELKKSITTRAESDLNLDYLIPLVDNMHRQRIKASDLLNRHFGLNVSCDLHSTWLAEKLKTESAIHNEETENILNSTDSEMEINDHIKETV